MPRTTKSPAGTARLSATVAARVSRRRALALLDHPGRSAWLGGVVEGEARRPIQRHLVDLELRVGEHMPRVTFRKAAFVDVGPASSRGIEPIKVGISWRAASLAPLFPVFSGTLTWADGDLSLDGFYAPPGGELGIVADRLLLNVAARGTARWLLERIAAAMLDEAA